MARQGNRGFGGRVPFSAKTRRAGFHACPSVRRLWKAALRTVTANNANPREWGTVGGRFSYLPHVSHKATETQRDKDTGKTLCAFVSLCEPPAVTANNANPREWGTVLAANVRRTSGSASHIGYLPLAPFVRIRVIRG